MGNMLLYLTSEHHIFSGPLQHLIVIHKYLEELKTNLSSMNQVNQSVTHTWCPSVS